MNRSALSLRSLCLCGFGQSSINKTAEQDAENAEKNNKLNESKKE